MKKISKTRIALFPIGALAIVAIGLWYFYQGRFYLSQSSDPAYQALELPKPFDPTPVSLGQKPLQGMVPPIADRPANKSMQIKQLLVIGFEGLNWDILNHLIKSGKAPDLKRFVEESSRGILTTGADPYATPEDCWRRLLVRNQWDGNTKPELVDPTSFAGTPIYNPISIKELMPDRKIALVDVKGFEINEAAPGLFLDTHAPSFDAQKYRAVFETETGLDFAPQKFSWLKDHQADVTILGINEPDKTQHRAYLGYIIHSIRGKSSLHFQRGFEKNFDQNASDLESVYKDLNALFAYLNRAYKSMPVLVVSVHGMKIAPYEIRISQSEKWFADVGIEGGGNDSSIEEISLKVGARQFPGRQTAKAVNIPVLTDSVSGDTTFARLSYFSWEIALPKGMKNILLRNRVLQKVRDRLADSEFQGDPFFEVGFGSAGGLVIRPSDKVFEDLPEDFALAYEGGVIVNRVQAGHPGDAKGVVLFHGPIYSGQSTLSTMTQMEILPIIMKAFYSPPGI